MSKEVVKVVKIELASDTWKKIKMHAIQEEITLPQAISLSLEKVFANKKNLALEAKAS